MLLIIWSFSFLSKAEVVFLDVSTRTLWIMWESLAASRRLVNMPVTQLLVFLDDVQHNVHWCDDPLCVWCLPLFLVLSLHLLWRWVWQDGDLLQALCLCCSSFKARLSSDPWCSPPSDTPLAFACCLDGFAELYNIGCILIFTHKLTYSTDHRDYIWLLD